MNPTEQIQHNQRIAWGSAAAGWERNARWYENNFAPAMHWLVESAGAAPGRVHLDVACGSGQPALLIARRVAATGRVVGVDIAPEMLAVASRLAERDGIDNCEFQEMGAEALEFDDETFDGVTCGYALMLCADPMRAAAEMNRVTRPGGALAVAVWDVPTANPFLTSFGGVVGQFLPSSGPPQPNSPGPFRFAAPGALEALLIEAGWRDVEVESVPFVTEFASEADHFRLVLETAAGLKQRLSALPSADMDRLRAALAERMGEFRVDGRLRVPAMALCARARKPDRT